MDCFHLRCWCRCGRRSSGRWRRLKGSVGQMVNQQDTVDTGDGSDSYRLCRSRTHWGGHPIEIRACHIAIPFFFTHSVQIAHNKAQGTRPIKRKVGYTLGTSLPLKISFSRLEPNRNGQSLLHDIPTAIVPSHCEGSYNPRSFKIVRPTSFTLASPIYN